MRATEQLAGGQDRACLELSGTEFDPRGLAREAQRQLERWGTRGTN